MAHSTWNCPCYELPAPALPGPCSCEKLLSPGDRTAVHLVGYVQVDLSGQKSVVNLVIRTQLEGGGAVDEMNLHFHPERIETVALDGVNHTDERLVHGQTFIRHEDEVD